jgi:hypothetical protein
MNRTIVVAENITPLKTSPDMLANKIPSDLQWGNLGKAESKRRRIRFASTVSQVAGRVLSRDDFSEDEKADYWIERKEYVSYRSKAKLAVTAVKKHGSAYILFLEESYEEAQFLSEFMVEDKAIEIFFGDPSRYTENVEMWSEANYGQRGLERFITSLQKNQRALERRETRRMVLIAAKSVSADELADLYAALAWTTCIFSRMLGHADYVAAHFAEDDPHVQLKAVQLPPLENEHHYVATRFAEDDAPVQPKSIQLPPLKNYHQSEQSIRNLKTMLNQELKLHAPSQDRRILKQGHKSKQDTLVSRAA